MEEEEAKPVRDGRRTIFNGLDNGHGIGKAKRGNDHQTKLEELHSRGLSGLAVSELAQELPLSADSLCD